MPKSWFPLWARAVGRRRAAKLVVAGDRARDRGDWANASINYRAALDADPGLARIWVQYGHALKEKGDLRTAEAAYRTAIGRQPGAADPYLQLGHVLKLQDSLPEAAQAYFDALVRDPKLHFARAELLALGYSTDQLDEKIGAAVKTAKTKLDLEGVPIEIGKNDDSLARRVAEVTASRSGGAPSAFPGFCILELNTESVIGWAFLPLEFHHTPVINVYRHGQLIAAGLSNRARPKALSEGPKYNWFEIVWADWEFVPSQAELSELVFQRGEDGGLCANPLGGGGEKGVGKIRVGDLLGAEVYEIERGSNFVSQLADLSALAIIHLYYLDYLGRPVDTDGWDTYLDDLDKGRLSVDGLRDIILGSDEFKRRGVRVSDRLGQVLRVDFLSIYREMAFDRSPPLRTYETLSADIFSTEDHSGFIRLCCSEILHQTRDLAEGTTLRAALDEGRISRLDVIREMLSDAAAVGRFVRIDGLMNLAVARHSVAAIDIDAVDEIIDPATGPITANAQCNEL